MAFSAGGGAVDVGELLPAAKSIVGFTVGTVARLRPAVVDAYRARLWNLLADGRLRPRTVVFPADRLDDAVALVAGRRNLGRVVLR